MGRGAVGVLVEQALGLVGGDRFVEIVIHEADRCGAAGSEALGEFDRPLATRRHGHRVVVRVGKRDGPAFEGCAELVDGRRDLEDALLRAYRRKYWVLVPLWMGRYIRRGLDSGRSVLVRITPASGSAA